PLLRRPPRPSQAQFVADVGSGRGRRDRRPLDRPYVDSAADRAGVAHLAERDLPKVEVAGSSPVSRSNSASPDWSVRRLRSVLICGGSSPPRLRQFPPALQTRFTSREAGPCVTRWGA